MSFETDFKGCYSLLWTKAGSWARPATRRGASRFNVANLPDLPKRPPVFKGV